MAPYARLCSTEFTAWRCQDGVDWAEGGWFGWVKLCCGYGCGCGNGLCLDTKVAGELFVLTHVFLSRVSGNEAINCINCTCDAHVSHCTQHNQPLSACTAVLFTSTAVISTNTAVLSASTAVVSSSSTLRQHSSTLYCLQLPPFTLSTQQSTAFHPASRAHSNNNTEQHPRYLIT